MRLDNAIISGWLDNTQPGVTRGGLELVGLNRPVQLILRGNCARDLAGTRLDFTNPSPSPQPEIINAIQCLQRGVVGEMTASHKVKNLLIPPQLIADYLDQKKKLPYKWENGIMLEWFSLANGRIIIESTNFHLKLSQHQWELDQDADIEQRLQNQLAMEHFMELIAHASETNEQVSQQALDNADEFEWEKRLRIRDTLEETAEFLSPTQVDDSSLDAEIAAMDATIQDRFHLVRAAHQLQDDVIEYLGESLLDHGSRSDLALAVSYLYDSLDEAWPESADEQNPPLETGFKIAMLKRALDATMVAIAACNTLELEDDNFSAIRADTFIIRDQIIDLTAKLRREQSNGDAPEA